MIYEGKLAKTYTRYVYKYNLYPTKFDNQGSVGTCTHLLHVQVIIRCKYDRQHFMEQEWACPYWICMIDNLTENLSSFTL